MSWGLVLATDTQVAWLCIAPKTGSLGRCATYTLHESEDALIYEEGIGQCGCANAGWSSFPQAWVVMGRAIMSEYITGRRRRTF